MQTVAIAGVGLIGGSFALALRRAGYQGRILGVSSPATIAEALRLNVIDEGATLEDACGRADLVYLSQPIRTIISVLPEVARHLKPGALVTDAGSTKVQIAAKAAEVLPPGAFLGGHPMAGKEQRGVAAAEASLFEGRPYILAPSPELDRDSPQVAALVGWVRAIGSRVVWMAPGEHDRVVANVSHLPQLLSTVLAASLAGIGEAKTVAGPAVLDMTRLALSDYQIWNDILVTNTTEIAAALCAIIDKLQDLQDNLTAPSIDALFRQGNETARKLRENR